MKKRIVRLTSVLLLTALLLPQLVGCSTKVYAGDLLADITPNRVNAKVLDQPFSLAITEFSLSMMGKAAESGQNRLLSPLSAMLLLSMIAGGAEENTLAQMESTMGLPLSDLNAYFYSLQKELSDEKSVTLKLSNSIWLREGTAVKQEFLQSCADYYKANAFCEPFDSQTLKKINEWGKNESDDLIPQILEEIDPDTLLYLMNCLLFEAKWEEKYEKKDIFDSIFTDFDGKEQNASFLSSEERCFSAENGITGFVKPYKGGRFAFMGILPPENSTTEDYLRSLSGETLLSAVKNAARATASTKVCFPEFTVTDSANLINVLTAMGISDAFDPMRCDLSSITDDPTYIGLFKQDSYIEVDRNGTKAAAISIAGVKDEAAPLMLMLNRPFIYGIVDLKTGIPLFLGVMNHLPNK